MVVGGGPDGRYDDAAAGGNGIRRLQLPIRQTTIRGSYSSQSGDIDY